MGTQLPLKKEKAKEHVPSPQFSAHVCFGQTAGWIKMPLGTRVGLGPGDIVLDGIQLHLPKKGAQQPQFSAHVLWPNG